MSINKSSSFHISVWRGLQELVVESRQRQTLLWKCWYQLLWWYFIIILWSTGVITVGKCLSRPHDHLLSQQFVITVWSNVPRNIPSRKNNQTNPRVLILNGWACDENVWIKSDTFYASWKNIYRFHSRKWWNNSWTGCSWVVLYRPFDTRSLCFPLSRPLCNE